MKYLYTFHLLAFWLISIPLIAQKKATKEYISGSSVSKKSLLPPKELKRRNDEITFQAKNKITTGLLDLLNTLTADTLGDAERNSIIQNSYLPNPEQLFVGDAVVIEDDIDPTHTSPENTIDLGVERYLRNLDLFYVKSGTFTISFSQVIISKVQEVKDTPLIKVFFTSTFKGKNNQSDIPYRPVQRVAELRAEKVEGKWRTFITRLAFPKPGETEVIAPDVAKNVETAPTINSPAIIFYKMDNAVDSIVVKWDQNWLSIDRSSVDALPVGLYQRRTSGNKSKINATITLSQKDKLLTFRHVDGTTLAFGGISKIPNYRLRGWLQIATGVIALGASYAGYISLQSNYNNYTSQLNALNNEYAIWQTLTQQPGTNPGAPMAFNSYASPGIYAVYGSGAIGSGLIINGIRQLIKSGKIKNNIRK